MIKSLNRQDVKESDYPKSDQLERAEFDHVSFFARGPAYTCDCCLRLVSGSAVGMDERYWDPRMNPRLTPVAGTIYWGCSTECARILFMIHHQYAALEAGRAVDVKKP